LQENTNKIDEMLVDQDVVRGRLVLRITPWERSALQMLAEGKGPTEVAGCLSVSQREIDLQLAALFARMGAANCSEAIADAQRRGLVN
jgi:DNA-binding NarL/FixJ family response regulator